MLRHLVVKKTNQKEPKALGERTLSLRETQLVGGAELSEVAGQLMLEDEPNVYYICISSSLPGIWQGDGREEEEAVGGLKFLAPPLVRSVSSFLQPLVGPFVRLLSRPSIQVSA